MVYRRYNILLIIRLILILGVMMCVPLAIGRMEPGQLFFTFLVIGIILVFMTIELINFLNRTLRELTEFLENIRNRDFTLRFHQENARGNRKKLYNTFNEVLKTFQEIRIEKEVHFRFLQHIIELIEIGIIVLDQEGKVILMNTTAGNLTGVPSPRNWDQIRRKNPEFAAAVGPLTSTGRVFFESVSPANPARMAIQLTGTRMLEKPYTLMAIQDIGSVVEQKETGAWIRLLKTLNHEIKNSVTPISSLADTMMMILHHQNGNPKTLEEIDLHNFTDLMTSAETIQQRSKRLHEFIDEYHKLTRIPVPNPVKISCKTLLEETASVFSSEMELKGIKLILEKHDKELFLRADPGLVQQVLINLVKNSMEAMADRADSEITLDFSGNNMGIVLIVKDNGEGIEEAILDDIFVPFYSTKTHGSGIGLSLVRQIMRLHGGNVRVISTKGEGTAVYLEFLYQRPPDQK